MPGDRRRLRGAARRRHAADRRDVRTRRRRSGDARGRSHRKPRPRAAPAAGPDRRRAGPGHAARPRCIPLGRRRSSAADRPARGRSTGRRERTRAERRKGARPAAHARPLRRIRLWLARPRVGRARRRTDRIAARRRAVAARARTRRSRRSRPLPDPRAARAPRRLGRLTGFLSHESLTVFRLPRARLSTRRCG
ncbi:Transcriptional regulator, AcrR family [Burkholderia sp. IT-111MI5]